MFVTDFEKMFDKNILTDFDLKTNDVEVLKVHKVVLAARSPVFYAMLKNGYKELKQMYVDIKQYDSVVMKEVLRFMYCQKVRFINEEITHKLAFAADMYQVEDLKEACINQIIFTLSTDNVLKSLILADQLTKNLYSECMELIIRYVSEASININL